jgi:hypothetical protein
VALTDQHFKVSRTTIREDASPPKFEADFHIEEKTTEPVVPFTLDDLITMLNNLITVHGVPGTARIGQGITFGLRWQ